MERGVRAASITFWTSAPWPAGPTPELLPLEGTSPVSTPRMTTAWMTAGSPSACNWPAMLVLSCPLTRAPSTATPVTAPTSRLVLVAEAAMPDRSGGTADSAADVIGTTVAPIPIPVSARETSNGR